MTQATTQETTGRDLDPADDVALRNLIARYAYRADAGDLDGFAALFTEDGSWTRENTPPAASGGSGLPSETVTGAVALKAMIQASIIDRFQRKFRHQMTDMLIEAGKGPDAARGFSRALITNWRDGPGQIAMCAQYSWVFRRTGSGWRIASASVYVLPD